MKFKLGDHVLWYNGMMDRDIEGTIAGLDEKRGVAWVDFGWFQQELPLDELEELPEDIAFNDV